MTSLILAGVGIAGAAIAVRVLMGSLKQIKNLTRLPTSSIFTTYYKGGFDPKMNRREAGMILGKLRPGTYSVGKMILNWKTIMWPNSPHLRTCCYSLLGQM